MYTAKVKEEACQVLQRGGFAEQFGQENILTTKRHAIETLFHHLDPAVCARCEKRIFLECQTLPAPVSAPA